MGVRAVPGEDGEWFEHAKRLYRARAELDSDDAQQQLAAGRFFFLAGDFDGAASAFRAAMKLDPEIPARYYLSRALTEKGDLDSAQEILKSIPANDPQYASAQQLLAQVEEKERTSNPTKNDTSPTSAEADAQFREGQSLYQGENYGGALKSLEIALRLTPQAAWATKAQIFRAVCLEKLANTQEAEAAMQALSGNVEAHKSVDLQLAYVQLLYDNGRVEDALKRIDEFLIVVPQAPMAHFWRAKILLRLHRVDEAARAAEESIRLFPDLPLPHNLLIRIYQMQGRTVEAAQQARWVQEYDLRVQRR
jgi:tetratricopeptide (TPR) repeat protein